MKKKQKFRFLKILSQSSGQAVTEYVLLIVVVITLGVAVGGPLSRGIRAFGQALIGKDGYYGCLTKEGKLPGAMYTNGECQGAVAEVNVALEDLETLTNQGGEGGAFGSNQGGSDGDSLSEGGENQDSFSADSSNTGADSQASSNRFAAGSSSGDGEDSGEGSGDGEEEESSDSSEDGDSGLLNASDIGQNSASPRNFRVRVVKKKKKGKKKKSATSGSGFSEPSEKKRRHLARRGGGGYEAEGYLGEVIGEEEVQTETENSFSVEGGTVIVEETEDQKRTDLEARTEARRGDFDAGETKPLEFGKFFRIIIIAILIIGALVVLASQILEYQNQD